MKVFRSLLLIVFCGITVTSCFDPPEYPNSPQITFKSLDFVKGGVNEDGFKIADTIVLVINFKDGDGDVGVPSDYPYPPVNDRWYFLKKSFPITDTTAPYDTYTKNTFPNEDYGHGGDNCTTYDGACWFIPRDNKGAVIKSQLEKFVGYSDFGKPGYDTLKPFSKPTDCTNWQIITADDDNDPSTAQVNVDTLYFVLNPHYNNIFVDFEIKNDNPVDPSKNFDKFDELDFFSFPNCSVRTWNGRIPVLSETAGGDTPLEGTIRYAIPSAFFQTIFGSQTMRLRVRIEDRSFNSSNEITTREFTFNE